jgi:hypothetical protein
MAKVAHLFKQWTLPAIALKRFRSKSLSLIQSNPAVSKYGYQASGTIHFFSKPHVLLSSLTVLSIGVMPNESILAQVQPAFAANVTLNPKFSPDPLELRGISGGSINAATVAGRTQTQTGTCNGFVDTEPDHTVILKTFFDYLSLQVQSPQDTTLVIKGPGGVWCNDDSDGKDPGVSGEWLAGTYQVWIGSYHKTKYVPYVLKITGVR